MTIQESIDQMIASLRSATEQLGFPREGFASFDLQAQHGAPDTATQVKIASRPGSLLRVRQAFPLNVVTARRPTGTSSNLTWIVEPSPSQRMAEVLANLS